MKRLVLTLLLALLASPAWAQCNGVFANNTVCGNITGSANLPRPTNPSAFLGAAGGTNGQIQYNNAGALGGFTMSQDCTTDTSTGVITCTKTNNVAFGVGATAAATGSGSLVLDTAATFQPKNVNTIRYASQFAGADWCVKLVAAIADLGANPGKIIIDSGAVTNACTAGSTIQLGNDHTIEFVSGGVYILNQTLQYGDYGTKIIGIGGGNQGNPPVATGTTLKWTGATGTPMILMYSTAFSYFGNVGLDCNSVSGCFGIHMNSDNAPVSTRNTLENFEITGFHVGIIIGSTNSTATSPATCSGTPDADGCTQNDAFTIRNFQLFGVCGDTTAEGIRINSLNAGQNSLITTANIQCTNVGVRVINMNDNLTLSSMNHGSVFGANPTLFVIESGVVNGPDLINNESEGVVGQLSVNDLSTGGTAIWAGNQFNLPSIIGSGGIITSNGNVYADMTVGGTANMISTGDVFSTVTFAGSGRLRLVSPPPTTGAGLPTCAAGRMGQTYTVTDATATTFNSILSGGGGNVITVGCDGTNWRIGN